MIDWAEHRHHRNDETGTRSAYEDDAIDVLYNLCDIRRTLAGVCAIEVSRIQVNEDSSHTNFIQAFAHPIPTVRTLGATVD